MLSRLEAAFHRETRFTADISHELRTPVAAILAQSEAALEEGTSVYEKDLALEKIRAKSKDMSKMISNLLMLSRMDANRVALEYEPIDLSEIVEAVSEEAVMRQNGRVKFVQSGQATPCECDPLLIAQLAANLIENALRHTPPGGCVRAEVYPKNGNAVFRITNTGASLSEEEISHLFERFYTTSASRSSGGNGLGLPIAKAIADAHGASLTCTSADSEITFTLLLPEKKKG